MRATAAPGEGNLVRLTVEIDEPEVDKALDGVVKTLARQITVPGFRPGKVPRQILEVRLGGAAALRAEALREVLPEFYAQAVVETEVDPIAPPDIDITAGEESGALSFDAVVQVRPTVGIPGYAGLRVTVPRPEPTEEEIDAQVDRLRENEAELIDVDRPVADDDHVTLDIHGTEAAGDGDDGEGASGGGEEVVATDDFLYRVGSATVAAELDESLRGSAVGDVLTFTATPNGSDQAIDFVVTVKDVKEKKLPEPTDEWAAESSEFDTVVELRADIADRILRVKRLQAERMLREGSVEALVTLVDDGEVPGVLVQDEAQQRLEDLQRRLHDQKIPFDQFLAATGRTPEDVVGEMRGESERAVKADLALRALADAEEITVTDEELDEEIAASAARMEISVDDLRARLDRTGRMAAVRSEQRKSKALDWLLEHVELVDEDGNAVSRADVMGEGGASQTTTPGENDSADEQTDDEATAGGEPPAPHAEATEETDR